MLAKGAIPTPPCCFLNVLDRQTHVICFQCRGTSSRVCSKYYMLIPHMPKKSFTYWAIVCELTDTAQKAIFFSPNVQKRFFPKKSHWNMIFLVLSGKMIFLLPENMILFSRRKMKDGRSQKIHGNIFRSDVLKRWSFQKNCAWIWSFSYHQERWHFFFSKMWSFFYGRKMKDYLSQKIHGNMFSVYSVKMVFLFTTNMKLPLCQKSKDDLLAKNSTKDDIFGITEKDDWYSS